MWPWADPATKKVRFLLAAWERPPEANYSPPRRSPAVSPQRGVPVLFPEYREPARLRLPRMQQWLVDLTLSAARVAKTEPKQEYSATIRTTATVDPETFPP